MHGITDCFSWKEPLETRSRVSKARVYVVTYGKYSNGSLFGARLDLSDYSNKEDFYEAGQRLHKDEEDAEYMFQN